MQNPTLQVDFEEERLLQTLERGREVRKNGVVAKVGIEPTTSSFSGMRYYRLSYLAVRAMC